MPIVSVLQPLLKELHKHPPPAGSVGKERAPTVHELLPDGRERGPRVEFTVPRGGGRREEGKRQRVADAAAGFA